MIFQVHFRPDAVVRGGMMLNACDNVELPSVSRAAEERIVADNLLGIHMNDRLIALSVIPNVPDKDIA